MLQPTDILQSRYRLLQQLGQNAGRQTWLAADLSAANLSVIVKLLAFSDQVNWNVLKLFEREAGVLRQLDHPRIPKYRDFFSIDDRTLWFGLVQNYIAGASLKAALDSRERFAIEKIYQIARELLDILIYLHDLNPPVLHRDIKPSNLIWGEDQQVYLVDFGAVQEQPSVPGQSFTVVGSYGYTPIEQFGGRAVPASDLYALGATLIHLLTGVCPADLPQQNLKLQWRDRVTCSQAFALWLDQLLNPDFNRRFQTARDAQMVLKTIVEAERQPRKRYDLSRINHLDTNMSLSRVERLLLPPRNERFGSIKDMLEALEREEVQVREQSDSAAIQPRNLPFPFKASTQTPSDTVEIQPRAAVYQIQKLPGTHIQVEKTPYALTIYDVPVAMSGRGCLVLSLNIACLFTILLVVVPATSVNGHFALILLLAGMTGLWWLNRRITRSSMKIMRFEGNQLTIQHLNQPDSPVIAINTTHVRIALEKFDSYEGSDFYILNIQTSTGNFGINMGYNWAQARWLEREINNWLSR